MRCPVIPLSKAVGQSKRTTLRSIGGITRHQRLQDNNEEFVTPNDMLVELAEDNLQLTRLPRSAHAICDEHNDIATASLIENWIDQTERRTWFCAAVCFSVVVIL